MISDEYSAVVMRRGPVLSLLSMTLNHVHYDCEILRLPLSDDGTAVSHILVVESLIATGP